MTVFWIVASLFFAYAVYVIYKQIRFVYCIRREVRRKNCIFLPNKKGWWLEGHDHSRANFFIVKDSEILSVKLLNFYSPFHNAVVLNEDSDYCKTHLYGNKNKNKSKSLNEIHFRKGLPMKYWGKKISPYVCFYPAPKTIIRRIGNKTEFLYDGAVLSECTFCGLKKLRIIIRGDSYE